MNAAAVSGLILPALLSACWEVTRPSRPVVAEVVPAQPFTVLRAAPVATSEVDESPTAALFPAAPPVKVGPSLQLSELAGIAPSEAEALFAPVHAALERCQTSSTGKLVLRLIAEPGSTHLRVIDPGGLDPAMSRCALSALGTVDVDEAIQQSWSRADAVRRVETQVVLSW